MGAAPFSQRPRCGFGVGGIKCVGRLRRELAWAGVYDKRFKQPDSLPEVEIDKVCRQLIGVLDWQAEAAELQRTILRGRCLAQVAIPPFGWASIRPAVGPGMEVRSQGQSRDENASRVGNESKARDESKVGNESRVGNENRIENESKAGIEAGIGIRPGDSSALRATDRLLENDLIRVSLDAAGEIVSIFDGESNKEWAGWRCNRFRMFRDRPSSYFAWEMTGSQMNLTLLRAPTWPDERADRGAHTFTYALHVWHDGWMSNPIVREA